MRAGKVDRRAIVAGVLTVLAALALAASAAASPPSPAARAPPRPGPRSSPASASRSDSCRSTAPRRSPRAPASPSSTTAASVMRNVTIHTIFWAPAGYRYDGSPGAGAPGYVPLIQQFFADVAHDSGSTGNVFSLLNQYGDQSGVGNYQIHYDAAVDSVRRHPPLPGRHQPVPVAVRGRHLRHRPPGPARGGQGDRRRRSRCARADQHLFRPAAARRRRVHHPRHLRHDRVRGLSLGVLARPRADRVRSDPRSPDRVHPAAGI